LNRLALAVIVVPIVIVVAVAGFLAIEGSTPRTTVACIPEQGCNDVTTSQSTCAPSPGEVGNATVTITETAGQWPPCSCALVDSNSNGTLYVSTNAFVGDDVCIAASMSASPTVSFEFIGPAGVFLSTPGCINSAFTAVSCEASWDTAQPDPRGNQIQPGVYELVATGESQSLRANFLLGPGHVVAFVTSTR
jgi:hypothetical protein